MKLELYYSASCPFSRKVLNYVSQSGIEGKVVPHDVDRDPKTAERHMELNGTDQVPCLVINGKPMLESDEIIEWLDENVASEQVA